MGGLTINSKATAKAIAAFPEMEGETLRVGQRVRVAPCIPEPILAGFTAREGRPCPRVELHPDNEEAEQLVGILIREDTRVIAPLWIQQNLAGLSDDAAARIVNRAITAIHTEQISALLYPSPEQKAAS